MTHATPGSRPISPQRVLVTGGAGFIGSHLVAQLCRSGRRVRVFDLPEVYADHLHSHRDVEVLRGDITRFDELRDAMRGCQEVYHLAANPNLWTRRARDFDAVNHQGTRHALRAAFPNGVRKFVHVSTESILTRRGDNSPITEDAELCEQDAIGPYCLSKLRAEMAAHEYAQQGYPVVIVNPTVPIGPGDRRQGPLTRLICQFAAGKIRGYMDAQVNLIDVEDAARGLVAAGERGVPGKRYLLAGETWTIPRLFELLSELTGRRPPRWRVPYSLALGYAWLEEQYCRIVPRVPAATVTGVRLTRRSHDFDGRATRRELGLSLHSSEEALREQVCWLAEQGQLESIAAAKRHPA